MEYLKLNNDVKMPVEGLGTFLMSPAEAEAASLAALEAGYEHIDTANAYMNEKAVGRAIAKSGVARDKLFVSTKLWPSVYEAGDAAIEGTLNRLGLDYVDMLILHQPVGNYLAAWKTMEKAYKEGKVRALGLSNFPQEKIVEAIDHAEIKPQLVTVECHPYFAQSDLREYLSQYGIVIEAWYPLGHGDKGLQEGRSSSSLPRSTVRRRPRSFFAGMCRWVHRSSRVPRIPPTSLITLTSSISSSPMKRWQRSPSSTVRRSTTRPPRKHLLVTSLSSPTSTRRSSRSRRRM